jgi:hypothetical protein
LRQRSGLRRPVREFHSEGGASGLSPEESRGVACGDDE